MPDEPGSAPENVDQLRSRIDQGKTGDKIDFPDPSAAPLGTDSEAGGARVTRRELALEAASAPSPERSDQRSWREPSALAVYVGLIVILALAFVAIIVWSLLKV